MDSDSQRKFARAICEKKRTRKEYVAFKRRFLLAQRRARHENSGSEESSSESGAFLGTPRRVNEPNTRQIGFTRELMNLARMPANRRRFSTALIAMAMALYIMSSSCYEYLRNFVPLPSRQTLMARSVGPMHFNATKLQNLSNLPDVCAHYRTRNEIGNATVYGVLAVDAVSFTRQLVISKTGIIQGSICNETVDAKRLHEMHASFTEFESFWSEKHSALISDAFVFQFQPINVSSKSFVCHITPSTQGKATERTVETLEEIARQLHVLNFEVLCYAMDGDTSYSKLHKTFYSEYLKVIPKDPFFTNFSQSWGKMVISDPLHVLKRARHRLLGASVHLGLTEGSDVIDVETLRSLLSLPSKTFWNHTFTKMHDDLAVSLFSLTSLIELYEKRVEYTQYFLPFCLLNAALSEKDLTVEERVNFLEVSFYFMLAYMQELKASPVTLPDRKTGSRTDVRPFSSNLGTELCNTIVSMLSVMFRFNGSLNLNRLGTNPLEHTFGAIRMRSRYKHTYDSMVKSLGKIETWKAVSSFLGVGSRICGRKTYYGQTVDVVLGSNNRVLPMDARRTVVALHIFFGYPISAQELEPWNIEFAISNHEVIVHQFFESIATIHRRLYPEPRKVKLNSRSILVTGGSNTCMIKRDHELISKK